MFRYFTVFFVLLAACLSAFAKPLPLPAHLTALASQNGQTLFQQAKFKGDYWALSQYYVTQKNLAYCGVASSVMTLNALQIEAPSTAVYAPFQLYTQENIFTPTVLKIITPTIINFQGVTLQELGQVLSTFDLQTEVVFANKATLAHFTKQAIAALKDKQKIILVNFHRATLGEKGVGHISPLAAYHAAQDRFLMLDVSRYKYPAIWVKSADLWRSMKTIDAVSKQHRGYVVVKRKARKKDQH